MWNEGAEAKHSSYLFSRARLGVLTPQPCLKVRDAKGAAAEDFNPVSKAMELILPVASVP